MAKLDRGRSFGTIYGITENGARYRQDGKSFNGRGIEIDENGVVVDTDDLIPDKPKEEPPPPVNNKEPEFERNWDKEKDPPSGFVGLTHDGWKNPEPERPEEPVSGVKCDVCGFVAKNQFGLNSHKRYKHPK